MLTNLVGARPQEDNSHSLEIGTSSQQDGLKLNKRTNICDSESAYSDSPGISATTETDHNDSNVCDDSTTGHSQPVPASFLDQTAGFDTRLIKDSADPLSVTSSPKFALFNTGKGSIIAHVGNEEATSATR